jgi:hypothetical protein
MTPSNDRRRNFMEGANNSSRVFGLIGSQVGAVENGNGMTIVEAKSHESGIVIRRHISQRDIEVMINIVGVARERREDKNLGARRRRSCQSGGRKGCKDREGFFNRIHGRFFVVVLVVGGGVILFC